MPNILVKMTSTLIKHPIMRYHGAKFRLAPWIMSFFPDHHTYVEPFGGAAGVLLQKPRSMSEVYNDLDRDIVNVFRVLQNPKKANDKVMVSIFDRDQQNNAPSKPKQAQDQGAYDDFDEDIPF